MGRAYKGPVQKAARLLTKARAAGDRLCGGAMTRLVEDLRWKPDGMGGQGFRTLAICWQDLQDIVIERAVTCHMRWHHQEKTWMSRPPGKADLRWVWYFHLHQGAARA